MPVWTQVQLNIYHVCLHDWSNNLFNFCLFDAGIVVRNTLVTYDRGNDRIGFLKTNCSELWSRAQFSGATAPAPAPLVSQSNDTNMEIPPTIAPSGSPPNVLPGAWLTTCLHTMVSPYSLLSSLALFHGLIYHDYNLSKHTFFYIGLLLSSFVMKKKNQGIWKLQI